MQGNKEKIHFPNFSETVNPTQTEINICQKNIFQKKKKNSDLTAGEEHFGDRSCIKSDKQAQHSPARKKPKLKAIKRPNYRFKPITHHFAKDPVESESKLADFEAEERKRGEKISLKK